MTSTPSTKPHMPARRSTLFPVINWSQWRRRCGVNNVKCEGNSSRASFTAISSSSSKTTVHGGWSPRCGRVDGRVGWSSSSTSTSRRRSGKSLKAWLRVSYLQGRTGSARTRTEKPTAKTLNELGLMCSARPVWAGEESRVWMESRVMPVGLLS